MVDALEHSKGLARALDLMLSRASELRPDDVISSLNKIEADFLSTAGASQTLELETKRRVAEWKFKLLSERDLPFSTIDKLRTGIHSLGFTNLETEGTVEIYYARYLVCQSRPKDARRVLDALLEKVEAQRKVNDVLGYQSLSRDIKAILSTLP